MRRPLVTSTGDASVATMDPDGVGATRHASPRRQGSEEEAAMLAEERDLAKDAQWKRIQQNTFTRWANEHLKVASRHIGSLETDLQDGLNLIALIEVLSGKRMPKHSRRPAFRSQKLENVSVALRFLERDEHIKIVNIERASTTELGGGAVAGRPHHPATFLSGTF
ncbi:filamin-A-like [Pollicipes pollicipes]|uniref:filamin-A-like n=1 Tax=Pollicipes pollicipes TaxID=41117 RepID=UPI001884E53C|nr:filamin-A-like [Pollicipes pollicipes]